MAEHPRTPRVRGLDVPFVEDRLRDRLANKDKELLMLREEPGKLATDWLARDWLYIGHYRYALGYPLSEVRQAYAQFTAAWVRVVELRGTGSKDFSTTNSWRCFKGVCLALVADEYARADELAKAIWDPPGAKYIGPRSEVCTSNQQRLAYAVKHVFQGHNGEADRELKRVWPSGREEEAAFLAKTIRGLLEMNDAWFQEGLLELLFWHAKQVKQSRMISDPDLYFCLPAVGLSILAVRRQLVPKSALPEDAYLAKELIPDD
jgi:hypothetical protein